MDIDCYFDGVDLNEELPVRVPKPPKEKVERTPRDKIAYKLQHYMPVSETGCWLFMGRWDKDGYGVIRKDKGPGKMFAHRYFYEHLVGPIPTGLIICHKCDTPACVNPEHHFLGTHQDNSDDKVRKGRQRFGPNHREAKPSLFKET